MTTADLWPTSGTCITTALALEPMHWRFHGSWSTVHNLSVRFESCQNRCSSGDACYKSPVHCSTGIDEWAKDREDNILLERRLNSASRVQLHWIWDVTPSPLLKNSSYSDFRVKNSSESDLKDEELLLEWSYWGLHSCRGQQEGQVDTVIMNLTLSPVIPVLRQQVSSCSPHGWRTYRVDHYDICPIRSMLHYISFLGLLKNW